jgi:alpha-1,2-mannosyltransferase
VPTFERGGVKFYKLQSVFAAVRLWGGSVATAYVFQGIISVSAVVAVIWIWRSNRSHALKAATMVTATLLATPYIFDYDLVVLGLPIAWLFVEGRRRGFLPWEKFVLAATWLIPGYARFGARETHLTIAPLVMITLMMLILRRATHNDASPMPSLAPASMSPN